MKEGVIFNIQRYSIHDGPGIRTTVFFKGCPLSCLWCHNPESQSFNKQIIYFKNRCISCGECIKVCESGILRGEQKNCCQCEACVEACYCNARELVGKTFEASELMREIEKDSVFFESSGGGVTFSGGEPFSQPILLIEMLKQCKKKGFHTVIDTCGYADEAELLEASEYTDLFLYDLKLMDEERHMEYTGVSNSSILKNLESIASKGNRIWLRIPVIPGINDDETNILKCVDFINKLGNIEQVNLLPYHSIARDKYKRLHKEYKLEHIKESAKEDMERIAEAYKIKGINIKIGG